MPRIYFFLIIFFCGLSSDLRAQISQRLLSQLPDSLQPANPQLPTFHEFSKIMKSAVYFQFKSDLDEKEIEAMSQIIVKDYVHLPTKKDQLRYLWLVVSYWTNRNIYRKASLMYSVDSTQKYNRIFRELIGKETNLYAVQLGKHYIAQGDLLMTKENFSEAYKSMLMAMTIFKKEKDYVYLTLISAMNSRMYQSIDMLPQSIAWSDSSIRFLGNVSGKSLARIKPYEATVKMANKAQIYVKLYQQTRKQSFADSAIQIASHLQRTRLNNKMIESDVLFMLMELSYYQKKYTQSVAYADSAWRIEQDTSYSDNNAAYYFFKGLSLLRLGKESEGKHLLDKINLAETRLGNGEILQELYAYEKKQGRPDAALKIHEQLMEFLNQSKINSYKADIFGMQQKYDLVTRDAQIDSLKSESIINKLVTAFVILIAGFGLVVFLINRRSSREKITQIVHQMEELTELHIQQIVHFTSEAKEQERQRVGQQLHDDLAGNLAGSLHMLRHRIKDSTESEDNRKLLTICEMIEESYSTIRSKSHEIYHHQEEETYWNKLVDNTKLFFTGSDINIHTNIAVSDEIRLSPEIKTALVYTLKEAIINVLKHARATEVEVLIYDEDGLIYLTVTDNGRGISQKEMAKSLGLKSIRVRSQKLGGNMFISPGVNSGTVLETTFSLV